MNYSKDKLSEKGKAFVNGMEYIAEKVLPAITIDKSDLEDCLSSTLKSIQIEVAESVMKIVKDVVKMEIEDMIIRICEKEAKNK